MVKSDAENIRSIEQLKAEYEKLNHRKIQTETQLDTATKQLNDLQAQAVHDFQTSDIAELEKKLRAMETENEQRRRDYQALLDGITRDLAKVEEEAKAPSPSSKVVDG